MLNGIRQRSCPLLLVLSIVISFTFPAYTLTADPPVPKPDRAVGKSDDAVDRGLGYLAKQQREDGWWDNQQRPAGQDADAAEHRRAITGLSLLAFLSSGHLADVGRFGGNVRRSVDALTDAVPADGYIGAKDGKPMYTQAIVTLALSQAYGVEPLADRRVKQFAALNRLVKVIVQAQAIRKEPAFAGGWRYTREAPDSDLSLSGWNALALRAAQDAGVSVPADCLKKAADFVARCFSPDVRGFAYQPGGAVQTGTTSTGIVCLSLLEPDQRPMTREAMRSLAERPSDGKAFDAYPFYGHFYFAQALSQIGDERAKSAMKSLEQRLIKAQLADGGWPKDWPEGSQEPGRVYRTATAVLTLAVPYRLLPVFQR